MLETMLDEYNSKWKHPQLIWMQMLLKQREPFEPNVALPHFHMAKEYFYKCISYQWI